MNNKLIDRVDDGFNYFNSGRLEELKRDDKYYIDALMQYIDKLESKIYKRTKLINQLETEINKLKQLNK